MQTWMKKKKMMRRRVMTLMTMGTWVTLHCLEQTVMDQTTLRVIWSLTALRAQRRSCQTGAWMIGARQMHSVGLSSQTLPTAMQTQVGHRSAAS